MLFSNLYRFYVLKEQKNFCLFKQIFTSFSADLLFEIKTKNSFLPSYYEMGNKTFNINQTKSRMRGLSYVKVTRHNRGSTPKAVKPHY